MPPEMRLIYASLKRSENRDIQRHADEKSIMSMFFTKHFFKYANKTAIEFRFNFSSYYRHAVLRR